MKQKNNYVVLKDVIYLDGDLWKKVKSEFILNHNHEIRSKQELTAYPIYERKSNGTVSKSDFIVRHPGTILFFDVTAASPEDKKILEEKYQTSVQELPVPAKKTKQMMSLLSVLSSHYTDKTLSQEELRSLGNEFVMVENREGGYKISKCILSQRRSKIAGNVYISVNPSKLSKELMEKIAGDVTYFALNDDGYYDEIDLSVDVKEFNPSTK